MNNKFISWGIFILLCFIWGSSFILMKWGMYDANQQPVLSPYNVAALRLLSSGLVMLPFLVSSIKILPKKTIRYVLLSGWLGSFFPAFLFCMAETKIDGALAGSLNSLTPLFVIITGALFFRIKTSNKKIAGVIIGLLGCGLLFYANYSRPMGYLAFSGFVILATVLYGINVNMVQKILAGVSSIQIGAIAFTGMIPPSLIVLFITGYFKLPLADHTYAISTLASCILGVGGTALASILFYVLVKKTGGLLASLVTYGIPFVAILWGVYYHEKITYMHMAALLVILAGVYIANRPEKKEM
jgi:drug/metabolite transporter (DMT)-like permease